MVASEARRWRSGASREIREPGRTDLTDQEGRIAVSRRENGILACLRTEMTTEEIASHLGITCRP